MLAVLILVVAGAGGFVGLLYGGGLSLGTKSVTVVQTVYQPVTVTVSTTTPNAYVLITYRGWIYTSFGSCSPKSGYIFLILSIYVKNCGYDTVPTGPHSGLNYGWYFHLDVDNRQFDPYSLSCMASSDRLASIDLLNGLWTRGFLAFEIPANFKSYSLIYKPETGNYNVQYVNEGFTTMTA
jgi:hypothetical protein